MTGWIIAGGLLVLVSMALVLVGRVPRSAWEITAAALLLGLAGYAWQGRPGLAGSPRQAADKGGAAFDEKLAEQRRGLAERYGQAGQRSEEHTSELQSLLRISYAVFCLKKK